LVYLLEGIASPGEERARGKKKRPRAKQARSLNVSRLFSSFLRGASRREIATPVVKDQKPRANQREAFEKSLGLFSTYLTWSKLP
jgi:hypothetical protein